MKSIPTRPKRVLAFDPGYERLGVAVVERDGSREALIYSECLRTPATIPFEERLLMLGKEAEKLIKKFSPEVVALEEIYFQKNEKTATKIAEVRGVLSYIARKNGLNVHHFTPQEVKIAVTGYGKSDKRAVTLMVSKLVRLPEKKRLDDEMDAIAIGITCLAVSR
jgi:crossover junction endodeoxyribonuclease RuvC